MSARTRQVIFQTIALMIFIMLLTGSASAQVSSGPSFYTYGCEFVEDPGEVNIRLALTTAGGLPLDPAAVTVRDVNGDKEVADFAFARAEDRLPARIMFVVDTTLNYPAEAMRSALENSILGAPFLFANDEIGLVKFNINAAQLGVPMTDKGALFNTQGDNLVALREQESGTAVLYDGIDTALNNATDAGRQRLIVMVLSNSAQSAEQSDTTLDQIVARANEEKAPIYMLMFDNIAPHTPDLLAAQQIANQTNGFYWVYGTEPGDDKRPEIFAERMTEFLVQAEATLDTEFMLMIPAPELTPDGNKVAPVAITIDTGTQSFNLDPVNCNVQFGPHEIAFTPVNDDERLIELDETLTIGFRVDPPASEGEVLTIKLWFNGDLLTETQELDNRVDLNLQTLTDEGLLDKLVVGGDNTLEVQLFRDEDELSAATLTGLRFQQRLNLTCGTEAAATCADVSGETALTATLASGQTLPVGQFIRFQMRTANGEYQDLNQLGSVAPVSGTGAIFPLEDINAKVTELFGETPDNLEAIAFVGDSLADAIFISDPVTITLQVPQPEATAEAGVVASPEPGVTPTPQPAEPTSSGIEPLLPIAIPVAVALLLLIIDLILWRRIRVARVKRLMRFPDKLDMENNPMKITSIRNGQRQLRVLDERTMNLGRGSSNDINLPDDTNVSREHGMVMWRKGQWFYTNRKPETQVTIDQKKIKGFRAHRLRDGTQIQVGDYQLICHYDMNADPDSLMKTQF